MKKHPLLFNYILFVNKAYIFISITILSLFILTGCTLRINAREEAEDIVATVIEYINKGDSEGLIALFCEEVKVESLEYQPIYEPNFVYEITPIDLTAVGNVVIGIVIIGGIIYFAAPAAGAAGGGYVLYQALQYA